MNKTAISWTKYTSNPIRFRQAETVGWMCVKVSDECRHCYAETLNMKWGTKLPFNAVSARQSSVFFDDRMAGKLYTIHEAAKVFPFDMTDIFGDFIPDYIRAAAWCVLLDLPHLTFQVLTKRPEAALDWQSRFSVAVASPEFATLRASVTHKGVAAALARDWPTVWPSHVWLGTSVGEPRSIHRVDTLRQSPAALKFLSCEPLLADLGALDLSGISWVIAGGESGLHLKQRPERWLQMAWAISLKNQCVSQGTPFWFKQDSGLRSEQRPYLVEADGSRHEWRQMPGETQLSLLEMIS